MRGEAYKLLMKSGHWENTDWMEYDIKRDHKSIKCVDCIYMAKDNWLAIVSAVINL
jgi:hypothetical protein